MTKKLLNERMMQLAGIKYPQIMGFVSNSPSLYEEEYRDEEGEVPGEQDTGPHEYEEQPDYDTVVQNTMKQHGLTAFSELDSMSNEDRKKFFNDLEHSYQTPEEKELYEHHGPGQIVTNANPEQFYAEVQDALDRGEKVICKCPGAMGTVERIDGNSMIINTPNGKGTTEFVGGEEVELVEDENENYIIQPISNESMNEQGWEKARPLHENTVKETIGSTRNVTAHKPHKFLLNERMMGFAGIVPLKPIGFVTNAPVVDNSAFKQKLNEIDSDLSRQELYNKLPMLHSSLIMELAERYLTSPTGKSWGVVVEELTEEYFRNSEAKKAINITLQSTGIR